MKKKKTKKKVTKRVTAKKVDSKKRTGPYTRQGTLTVSSRILNWALENDPEQRDRPYTFLSELLKEKVGEEKERLKSQRKKIRIQPKKSSKDISSEAQELLAELKNEDITILEICDFQVEAHKENLCAVGKRVHGFKDKIKKGDEIIFVQFGRNGKPVFNCKAPVLAIHQELLEEAFNCQ